MINENDPNWEHMLPNGIAELIKEPIQNSDHEIIIIDGIRSIHEINVLKETGDLKLLAVEASSDTRFNFLSQRKRSDDPLTREKFEERDNREIGIGLQEITEKHIKFLQLMEFYLIMKDPEEAKLLLLEK